MELPTRFTRGGYGALSFALLGSAFVSVTILAAVLGDWLVALLAGLMAVMTVMLRGIR
ncbi:MAG TPA: hypothetical protein VFY79_04930 [Dehalococcoidia bacterium]|nr:hypothetical protein [Dehalococcoidia bacterium]